MVIGERESVANIGRWSQLLEEAPLWKGIDFYPHLESVIRLSMIQFLIWIRSNLLVWDETKGILLFLKWRGKFVSCPYFVCKY